MKNAFLSLGKYAILPAILFSIPLIFFLQDEKFEKTWLLYLGNALFLFCIFVFVLLYSKKSNTNSPLNAGLSVTFMGIAFCFILAIICIIVFAPGLFNIGAAKDTFHDMPAALPPGHRHGVLLMVLADLIIGNVTAGSFGAVMASGAMRRHRDGTA